MLRFEVKEHDSQKMVVYCKALIEILANHWNLHISGMIHVKFKENDLPNNLVRKSFREKGEGGGENI